MKRINLTFAILGLVLSIVTLSCKKETLPGNEPVESSQQDNAIVLLPNEVIIEWSNIAFETADGLSPPVLFSNSLAALSKRPNNDPEFRATR